MSGLDEYDRMRQAADHDYDLEDRHEKHHDAVTSHDADNII